jgi:hypothetical protein
MSREYSDTPLRWQPTPDGRSRGTFTQFIRHSVAAHPDGMRRQDLIRDGQKPGAVFRLPGSRRGIHAAIARLVRMGELVEDDGILYLVRSPRAAKRNRGR